MIAIEEVLVIRAPIERCFDMARSVEVHLLGNIHCGEQAIVTGGVTSGLLKLGDRVTFRAKHFLIWHQLTSEIAAMERPTHFQDAMVEGIFRAMRHDRYFRPVGAGETEMRDVFTFAAPIPILGRIAEIAFLGRYMRTLLRERMSAIRIVAEPSPEMTTDYISA